MDRPKFSKSEKKVTIYFSKNKNIDINEKEQINRKLIKSQSEDDLIAIKINLDKKTSSKIKDFHIIKEIGEGAFGSIYLAKKENKNKLYALKVLNKEFLIKMEKTEEPIIEKNILSLCNHPSIIKLISTFQTQKYLYFVLEYCPNKDLNHLIKKFHIIPYNVSKQIIAELVNAIEYLHIKMNISHNDLKPDNIMLDKNYHIKLIDFSTSKIHEKIFDKSTGKFIKSENFISNEIIGTIEFLSPEMINHTIKEYRTNDIWALGIIIYIIYNGESPFKGKNDYCTCEKIKKGVFSFLNMNIPEEAKDLINHILVLDVENRYNIEQIKEHKFFEDINWDNLLNNNIPIDQNLYDNNNEENANNHNSKYDNFYFEIDNMNEIEANKENESKKDYKIDIFQNNYSDDIIKDFYYGKYINYNEENNNKLKKNDPIIYEGIVTANGCKDKEKKEIRLIFYNNYSLHMANIDNNKVIGKIEINKNTLIKIENKTELIIDKYKFKSSPKEINKWYYLVSDIQFCKDK